MKHTWKLSQQDGDAAAATTAATATAADAKYSVGHEYKLMADRMFAHLAKGVEELKENT